MTELDLLSAYKANPFHTLGATPRNTREELVMLQRDEALFGNEQAANVALSKLTHPESRLEAEIYWFPKAAPEDVDELLHHVESQRGMPRHAALIPAMPSILAQFNAVRLLLSIEPIENAWDLEAHILSLATIADGLLTEQVMDDINDDRKQAAFTALDYQPLVDTQIENLLNETIMHIMARRPSILTHNAILSLGKHFETSYKKRDSAYRNSYFLELAAEDLRLL